MYSLSPITPRVAKMRERYRNTRPEICIARYKLITEFYQSHPAMTGILKRAKCLEYICQNIPVRIDENDIIVGAQSSKFRASALYPETSVDWFFQELDNNHVSTRKVDPYILSTEDKEYMIKTRDFWAVNSISAKVDEYSLDGYFAVEGNGVTTFRTKGQCVQPVGHFTANHDKAIRKGFSAIRAEAEAKIKEYEAQGMPGSTIEQYNFYRAVSIVCRAMITLTKRYRDRALELAREEKCPDRRRELEYMARILDNVMDKPCRTFHEAVQTIYMYQTCLCLDGNMHGISFGRVDQYLGSFYDADIAAGRLTAEYAQEIMDMFLNMSAAFYTG